MAPPLQQVWELSVFLLHSHPRYSLRKYFPQNTVFPFSVLKEFSFLYLLLKTVATIWVKSHLERPEAWQWKQQKYENKKNPIAQAVGSIPLPWHLPPSKIWERSLTKKQCDDDLVFSPHKLNLLILNSTFLCLISFLDPAPIQLSFCGALNVFFKMAAVSGILP